MTRVSSGLSVVLVGLALAGCPATPGVTCHSHEDCRSMAEGYCARAEVCTRACETSDDCDAASACVAEGRRRVCLPTCEVDAQCVAGFGCQVNGDARVCRLLRPLEPPK